MACSREGMIECAKARESDGDERRGGVERMRMNVCDEPNCKECAAVTSYFPQPPRAFAATAAATSATDDARFGSPQVTTRSQLNTTVSEKIYGSLYLVCDGVSGPSSMGRVSF